MSSHTGAIYAGNGSLLQVSCPSIKEAPFSCTTGVSRPTEQPSRTIWRPFSPRSTPTPTLKAYPPMCNANFMTICGAVFLPMALCGWSVTPATKSCCWPSAASAAGVVRPVPVGHGSDRGPPGRARNPLGLHPPMGRLGARTLAVVAAHRLWGAGRPEGRTHRLGVWPRG